MMLAAAAVLASTTALGGAMWQCEGYVLTDRPWDYDGCTEVGSGRAYGEQAAPKPQSKARSGASAKTDQQWFHGGTLHQATVGQWLRASTRNKVATCGDWLSATSWKGALNSPLDFARLHVQARKLAAAVDDVARGDVRQVPETKVAAVAALLIKLSDELRP
jgi:hypothetical protein